MADKSNVDLVDEYYEVRQKRLEADRAAARLKAEEVELKAFLLDKFREEHLSALGGTKAIITLTSKVKPNVVDWDLLYAHILETKNFAFLHKRVTEETVREQWDDGQVVPGVTTVELFDFSFSKPKAQNGKS